MNFRGWLRPIVSSIPLLIFSITLWTGMEGGDGRLASQPLPSADVIYPANSGVFNVRSFGAAGNGTTDDTAAIQATVVAAGAHQGGVVYVPAGTYLVSDTIWWADFGTTPAQAAATIDRSRGCITGVAVQRHGTGFQAGWNGLGGVLLTGGGGSGADVAANISGGAVASIRVAGGCTGHGYSSAPLVRPVNWHSWIRLQGQNRATTTIRLKDNAAGFGNAACIPMYNTGAPGEYCHSVLHLASSAASDPTGAGENGYFDDVYDLTIDTGQGNPGAQAIDWNASNTAAIRNVTIQGSGRTALNTSRNWGGGGNGPALVKNLTVNGSFDYGIVAGGAEVGLTFEHIWINNPKLAGFWNKDQNVWIRDLNVTTMASSVFGVINEGDGNMTLIDSKFTARVRGGSAVQIRGTAHSGWLHCRNLSVNGFGSAIQQHDGKLISGQSLGEYTSTRTTSLFPAPENSLNLPIRETPLPYNNNNFAEWANVLKYGAAPNDSGDDTIGLQAALNSGKPVVFLPNGVYKISRTLHIPSTVRSIKGPLPTISIWSGQRATYPVFSCEASSGGGVEIRGVIFDIETVGSPTFSNSCTVPLTIADVFNAVGYENTPAKGLEVYFENAAIPGGVIQHGGNAWARQLDIETGGSHVINDGAIFWTLGYKTEGTGSDGSGKGMWYTENGGSTEILGAFNSTSAPGAYVGYSSVNSTSSISALSAGYRLNAVFTETRKGVTKLFPVSGSRLGGTAITLYSAGRLSP
jgi:hypothetical protein